MKTDYFNWGHDDFDVEHVVLGSPAESKYTYYMKNGKRVVLTGSGDFLSVLAQNGYGTKMVDGVRKGDDHDYRWNDAAQKWECMLVEFA